MVEMTELMQYERSNPAYRVDVRIDNVTRVWCVQEFQTAYDRFQEAVYNREVVSASLYRFNKEREVIVIASF